MRLAILDERDEMHVMHGYSHTGLVTQVYCFCSVNGIAGGLGDKLFVYTV
jgi:hypothetical protein